MADAEHLKILKQGMEAFNQWRAENPYLNLDFRMAALIGANLSGTHFGNADLSGANLSGANLTRANLRWANLANANLTGANLSMADLKGADLSEANLAGARLSGVHASGVHLTKAILNGSHLRDADLSGADLSEASLTNANLIGADLTKAKLMGANLRETDLSEASLTNANLSWADLTKADLTEADVRWADLTRADLGGVDLRTADLGWAHLTGTNLCWANLRNADLTRADFSEADLTRADLCGADLSGADLSGASLTGADLTGADLTDSIIGMTVLGNMDLSNVQGLDSVTHRGPSTLGIDTVVLSGGKIPETFLRGCGVPDIFIDYVGSLTMRPVQYYSCFISYSTDDQEFAQRLYNDLQSEGVRCWFAPEDVQGGKKLHEQIDEAIRVHDRLLLILSPKSIASEWVKTEIAKARKREIVQRRRMLFPVRLVDMEALNGWECFDADAGKDSAREIREYYIPDFSNWQANHETYRREFEKLLRDLEANR